MPDQPPIVLPQNAVVGPLVPQWKGVMKIIESEEVESYTNEGWLVLGSYEEKTYEEVHGYEPRGYKLPESHHNSYNDDGTVGTSRPMPSTRWKFIIGKDKESVIAKKSERIAALEGDLKQSKEQTEALTKEAESMRGQISSSESNANYYREQNQKAAEELSGRDERIRKMEADLGKLRAAIGDLKFKEILAEDKDGG